MWIWTGTPGGALRDRLEADLLRITDALVERRERVPVVEIRCVHGVPGSAQRVGERQESCRLSLGVVEEQYLGHGGHSYQARCERRYG